MFVLGCRHGNHDLQQVHEQVLHLERSVNNIKTIEEIIMHNDSQQPYIKYKTPLVNHMTGTVQNHQYVMVHSSWLLVPLLAWTILSRKNFHKLFVKLPTLQETTFEGQLPVLNINIIIQALKTILTDNLCPIHPDNDIQRSQQFASLYFSEAWQNRILNCLSHRFQEAYCNLTAWWNTKFQLERMQFTMQHYPPQNLTRRMSTIHTDVYQAAPYLQQGRVCNIVQEHAQFYSHSMSMGIQSIQNNPFPPTLGSSFFINQHNTEEQPPVQLPSLPSSIPVLSLSHIII